MIKYDGQAITYDDIGNPLTYRDGFVSSWSNGRQLDSYTKDGETVNYTYDTNGMRLSKTVDGVEYTYLYKDGLLVQETRGSKVFNYSYDANGKLTMLKYQSSPTGYVSYLYYALNSRGDVIGLYNASGGLIAKYTYDVWGNVLSVTNASGVALAETALANVQPFRYRSYYYDTDSGLYYLQSRYYDPITHRFINADVGILLDDNCVSYNLFAYCLNNPITYSDPLGLCASAWAKGFQGPCPGQGKPGCMDYKAESNDVPYKGEPGSHVVSPDGTKERVYGPDRLPSRDRHHTNHGNPAKHPYVPHDHDWYEDENGVWKPDEGYPSSDGPLVPQTPSISFDFTWLFSPESFPTPSTGSPYVIYKIEEFFISIFE